MSNKDYILGVVGIDDNLVKIIEKYGQPTSQMEHALGKVAYTEYHFNGGFEAYALKGTNSLLSIEDKSNNIYTSRNVAIDTTNTEVESIYGNSDYKYTTEKNTIIYMYCLPLPGNPQLYFEFDLSTKQVIRITIAHSGL